MFFYQLDEALQAVSPSYAKQREKGKLSQVRILQLQPGTMYGVKDKINKAKEITSDEYKVPRLIEVPEAAWHLFKGIA